MRTVAVVRSLSLSLSVLPVIRIVFRASFVLLQSIGQLLGIVVVILECAQSVISVGDFGFVGDNEFVMRSQ